MRTRSSVLRFALVLGACGAAEDQVASGLPSDEAGAIAAPSDTGSAPATTFDATVVGGCSPNCMDFPEGLGGVRAAADPLDAAGRHHRRGE